VVKHTLAVPITDFFVLGNGSFTTLGTTENAGCESGFTDFTVCGEILNKMCVSFYCLHNKITAAVQNNAIARDFYTVFSCHVGKLGKYLQLQDLYSPKIDSRHNLRAFVVSGIVVLYSAMCIVHRKKLYVKSSDFKISI